MAFQPWRIVTPTLSTGTLGGRTPSATRSVLAAFNVESNPDFQPDKDGTYCNIFLNRATKALGCEIPMRWPIAMSKALAAQFNAAIKPLGLGGLLYREMRAHHQIEWLEQNGNHHGWRKIDASRARIDANAGFPTVVTWLNREGTSHVAMLIDTVDSAQYAHIVQAGASCLFDKPITKGFPASILKQLRYWSHD